MRENPRLYRPARDLSRPAGDPAAVVFRYVLAPALGAFTRWLLEETEQAGIRRLYFLARDGYLMYRCARIYAERFQLPIECRYLCCSRYSLRLPMYHRDMKAALDYICRGGIEVTLDKILDRSGIGEAEKRISELYMYDVLRADRCISVNSLEARVPFGDLDFVRYVMSVDPEKKLNQSNKGTYLLRTAFEGDYLPYDILYREKAAFSDAVGHSMVDYLKEYAESKYTDEEYEEKRKKYTHATPFTKESLLYRELFEKYYPGQGRMIADFWMPNKSWKGCDVNDPSARVLSNYGDSGK